MSLGNWGESFLRDAAGGFFGSEYLRDFTHASKTFRTNSYQNAPKFKFSFHTYFLINPDAATFDQTNFGLLVKDVKLPTFSFQTAQLNQYNRKRIVQTKIKYDPIEITFHDDCGDQVNQLWEAYYKYYYNDGAVYKSALSGNKPANTAVGPRNIYNQTITGRNSEWGFNGGSNTADGAKTPFFYNITVYGFNQHNYTAYTLVNPIITSFSHDTYNYAENGGTMQNKMTIDYETVVYNYGALDGNRPSNSVPGFGDEANYDRRLSPISVPGANSTILGQGGLIDAAGSIIGALSSRDPLAILGAVRTGGLTYNAFKNVNLGKVATMELNTMLRDSIENTPNTRNSLFSFPIAGSSPGPNGLAGSPVVGGRTSSRQSSSTTAGTQNNGASRSQGLVNSRGLQTDLPFNPNNPRT